MLTMIKKLISLLCVLTLTIGVLAVTVISANAVEPAKTIVDVKNGQEVVYCLKLSDVEQPIIGCDFSVYYDSSLLELQSVADFNDKTDEEEWTPMINPDLDGEVRGNWSILNGVKFTDQRNFLTLTFKAKDEGSADISYFIRYMYDNNIFNSDDKPQITDYLFVCDVAVDGDEVLQDAQPGLNVEEPQTSGLFVNSVTGDSKDADADIPGTVVKKTGANAGTGSNNADNGDSGSDNAAQGGGSAGTPAGNVSGGGSSSAVSAVKETSAPPATTADGYFVTATDAQGNVTATSDQVPKTATADIADDISKGGTSPVIWIIIALVVLAGGGAAAYFFMKKKSATAPTADAAQTSDSDPSADNKE